MSDKVNNKDTDKENKENKDSKKERKNDTLKTVEKEKNGNAESNFSVLVLSLNEVVIFPFSLSPLVVDGEKAIQMAEKASKGDRLIGLFSELTEKDRHAEDEPVEFDIETFEHDDKKLSKIGVLGRIVKLLRFPDGTVRILVRGLKRVLYKGDNSALPEQVYVENIIEKPDDSMETAAMAKNAVNQFQEVLNHSQGFPEELKIAILNVENNVRMVDLIADAINISFKSKLGLLVLSTVHERLQLLTILLNREVEVLHLGSEIQSQVHNALGKSQREFFLREQLKTIKKELGEGESDSDVAGIKRRLKKLDIPEQVEEVIKKECERLEMVHQASGEYHIIYTYIDWLLSVPWNLFSNDNIDIKKAKKILDRDHYDLTEIKDRILDFLAVLQLKDDRKAPILCFVGPPGVGKTSLGRSIARAMRRKFVRISLGGVRDEAEIRGHRRTYIGALPGRIIQGMKKAGSSNPVFMLDELDKLGNDFRGDPASALLEVLDPEQNKNFSDHYLEVDYDLSSVMFIATANIIDTIPPALMDRMEIVRLPGYTPMEKKQIAKKFLIPRQIKENGLTKKQFNLPARSIDELINYYTREAGVRNLERTIAAVCRKVARKIVEGTADPKKRIFPKPAEVRELIGPRKFLMDEAEKRPRIGLATGLAWTRVGGTILSVEVTKMPGKGELKLTGSLGNVMKESAQTAFSYIKSSASKWKIKSEIFKKNDFHIHVPAGATPKDGPSAGITITAAMLSLMTGRKIKAKTAMTGEITLRGRITAVGGIKEKIIAAHRAGFRNVIMPEENKKDLEDIPEDVQKKIQFHFVKNINSALKILFEK